MGRFVFVGDVIADDTVDAAELRATVEHVAGGADATLVGNLEIPVCEEDAGAPPLKLVTWRVPASVAARLAAGGFSALGLANNHSVSWGIGGLMRSIELLREAGIAPIGAGHGLAEAIRPWRSADGAVAVFALNCTVPGESAAAEGREGTLALRVDTRIAIDAMRSVELPVTPPEISGRFDRRQLAPLRERIGEQTRAGATVVVMLHWGSPYTLTVFDYQFELSELLINAGAKLLVGCHSHVAGATGRYRDGLVLFSLGNFLWSPALLAHASAQVPRIRTLFERWARIGLAVDLMPDTPGWFPLGFRPREAAAARA